METFVISLKDGDVDVTRGETYTVLHMPGDTPIQKTGIIMGLSTNLRFLQLDVAGVHFAIPVDEITGIEKD